MPNMSIMVDYDLMDDKTADPMYLEYITQQKARLHYALIQREAELEECAGKNKKVADDIEAQISKINNFQYSGGTQYTGSFKMMLKRFEELKEVKVGFDKITGEVQCLIKGLKADIEELQIEVEFNEKLIDEAEARQDEAYEEEINDSHTTDMTVFHRLKSEDTDESDEEKGIKREEEQDAYNQDIEMGDIE